MSKLDLHHSLSRLLFGGILALGVFLWDGLPTPSLGQAPAGDLPAALKKPIPEDVADLLVIQKQVQKVVPRAIAATVGIQVGRSAGSGVIVSSDGYVLTAGHVAVAPDRNVTIILPDGKKVKGKSLGMNRGIDSGLIKITEGGKWPFTPMGKSASLRDGQWCLAIGHPGGFKKGRPPVVRLGRVTGSNNRVIQTDCALVGGDSGGPLFDLEGNVIGIHSRISESISANIHVPVDTYRETWDRLAKGEDWGGRGFGRRASAYFGIILDEEATGCVIKSVTTGSPAQKAGLRAGDKIVQFKSLGVDTGEKLRSMVANCRPGDEVEVEFLRGPTKHTVTVRLTEPFRRP